MGLSRKISLGTVTEQYNKFIGETGVIIGKPQNLKSRLSLKAAQALCEQSTY